jgi:hypothetical protein
MENLKLKEFLTVMTFAIAAGVITTLIVLFLKDTPRAIGLILLGLASIICWNYLRRHFGRNN